MPNSYETALKAADRPHYRHNAETADATFIYNSGANSSPIKVIFESQKELRSFSGDVEVITRKPHASARLEQFTDLGIPNPKRRDQLVINGVTYDIEEATDDGINEGSYVLQKETP